MEILPKQSLLDEGIPFRVLRRAMNRKTEIGHEKDHQILNAAYDEDGRLSDALSDYPRKGSSRIYLAQKEPHPVKIDGVDTRIPVGLKVSLRGKENKKHDAKKFDGLSLGALQNRAEHNPANDEHRVLIRTGGTTKKPEYKYNPHGVLPPLIKHDQKHHEWSFVGHIQDLNPRLAHHTRTKEYPHGMSAESLEGALRHAHKERNGDEGGYHPDDREDYNTYKNHPVFKQFNNYHAKTGLYPRDYSNGNLGVWTHPKTGQQHIIMRDHGYDDTTSKAYMGTFK